MDGKADKGPSRIKKASVAIFVGIAALGVVQPATADHGQRLPRCYEDEIFLVGVGDFGHGRWTRYDCVHPEDLTRMAKEDAGIGREIAEGICEHRRFWKREYGIGPIVSEACDG